MNISVELVKQLRDITSASLKDCKDCLVEANGDLELAQELLKKKGIASAGKKGDRDTKEGKVGALVQNNNIAIVKLGCETDFVAKNELFDSLIESVLQKVIAYPCSSFDGLPQDIQEEVHTTIAEIIAKLGENMKVIELVVKTLPSKNAYIYTHAGSKLVAAVYYNPVVDGVEDDVKKVGLQIAAMDPTYLAVDSIPADQLASMKAEFEEEVKASGKPEAVIPNIVAGKLNKKYSEVVLLEQGYIGDETQKIKDIVAGKAEIVGFDRIGFAN